MASRDGSDIAPPRPREYRVLLTPQYEMLGKGGYRRMGWTTISVIDVNGSVVGNRTVPDARLGQEVGNIVHDDVLMP